MSTALQTLTGKLASRFDMGDGAGVIDILKSTAFKVKDGTVSDAQMTALLVIANQYGLNPFTKEIYAYPDKNNGIVPVVGVDGWSRIINERPELDGIEFNYSEEKLTHKGRVAHEWIECAITRNDRSKPIVVREYFDEVVRTLNFATPWDTHPKRMHRHKALIQCARLAFGFGGIYDQDEAERIVESDTRVEKVVEEVKPYTAADFAKNLPKWRELVASGKKTGAMIVAMVNSKAPLTDEQTDTLLALRVTPADVVMTAEEIEAARAKEIREAQDELAGQA